MVRVRQSVRAVGMVLGVVLVVGVVTGSVGLAMLAIIVFAIGGVEAGRNRRRPS